VSRPVRKYQTIFTEGTGQQLMFETIGETPCAAKNLGFYLLERHLKQHPELPENGWWLLQHLPIQ